MFRIEGRMWVLRNCIWLIALFGFSLFASSSLEAQAWIDWNKVTSTNLVASPSVGVSDVAEKDYIAADFDQDGDPDVICGRKLPFTTFGERVNVLFMNIDGVLTDQTAQLCPDFATPDNARDVMTGDFNGDGWIDFVIGNAGNDSSNGQQPRIFMNQGVNGMGQWQGFTEESSRLPLLFSGSGSEPNACAVGVGDLTGNGRDDIYLVDYNNSLEDRLLINDGTGNFLDQTTMRLSSTFVQSAFATAGQIVDVNADGFPDIVKNTTPSIRIAYNDGTGNFPVTQNLNVAAAYHFDIGDLNNDGKNDIFVVQDGQDQYQFNASPPGAMPVNWNAVPLTNSPLTIGFGGNVHIEDIDGDGNLDVGIADTDTDVPNCAGRRMAFLQSNGAMPNPTLVDPYQCQSGGGGNCEDVHEDGTYDFVIADFNLDGAPDMLLGHCDGTDLFFQVPPIPPVFPIDSLSCIQSTIDVDLAWVNPQGYDNLEVRRDGATVANLPGTATSYTDLAPGAGDHSYTVIAEAGGIFGAPVSCVIFVSTVNAPSALTCVQFDEDVQLNWQNNGGIAGGDYDNVEIRRNSDLIAILPGNAEQYLDVAPSVGNTLYLVTATIAGDLSAPASCTLNVAPTNATDLVLDFTQDDTGMTNSARAIAEALLANGRVANLAIVSSVSDLVGLNIDPNDFERVWVELGVFPNNKLLTPVEGALLADYVTDGVGGSDLYLSGGDTFFVDPQTALHQLLDLTATSDGFGGVSNVRGLAGATCDLSGFTQVEFDSAAEDNSVDRISATGSGEDILRANVGGNMFTTGVFTDVPNGGVIIAQSCELGGIGAPHDRQELVEFYLHCFPSGFPPPVASFTATPMVGTVPLEVIFNSTSEGFVDSATWLFGDGGIEVGNSVIHTYNTVGNFTVTLTVDGPGGTNVISVPNAIQVVPVGVQFIRGDVNDDQQLNIGDAVALLDYLFGGGTTDCESSLDANDDGSIDVADAVRLLGYLFTAGGDLNAPFPDCGLETTTDALTCTTFGCP